MCTHVLTNSKSRRREFVRCLSSVLRRVYAGFFRTTDVCMYVMPHLCAVWSIRTACANGTQRVADKDGEEEKPTPRIVTTILFVLCVFLSSAAHTHVAEFIYSSDFNES